MPEMIPAYAVGEQWREAGRMGFENETGGYPGGWIEGVSPEERVAAHSALLEVPETPAGKVYLGRSIVVEDFAPVVHLNLRDYTAEELEELTAQRVAEIKAECRRRILAVMDKDQQDNSLALGLEMTCTYGADPVSWPEEERAVYEATLPKWAQIKALRTASNAIEAALPADAEGLCLFSAASADWPA